MDLTGIDFGLVKQGLALQERIEREEAIVAQLAQDIQIGRASCRERVLYTV